MKIQVRSKSQSQSQSNRRGNVLLVTLLTCVILGVTLASFLVLVSNQNRSVMRSLAWNSAIPVLEAGIEEALTHLSYHDVWNLSGHGWSTSDGRYFEKEIRIDDNHCLVAIDIADPASETPIIYSTAFVRAPLHPASQLGLMQAQLGPTLDDSRFNEGYIRRSARVRTARDAFFARGMVADSTINLNGNNVKTDSFNSGDERYSTNGRYDPAKARSNGDVATNSGLINTLDVGNADIKGSVSTGPGGAVTIGPNGTVGDQEWHDDGNKGIQPGHMTDDMNVEFVEVRVPFSSPNRTTYSSMVDGVTYNHVMDTGNYELQQFGGNVLVTGHAVLHVTDLLSFSGNDVLMLAPGASLKVYVSAATASFAGNANWNENGSALNLQYYGLPSNTRVAISGNGAFTGTIYAPAAELTLNGGGKDNYDFVGASVSKTVRMNGKVQFHYDELLATKGAAQGYIPISWDEM
jgi:hypothetical protein